MKDQYAILKRKLNKLSISTDAFDRTARACNYLKAYSEETLGRLMEERDALMDEGMTEKEWDTILSTLKNMIADAIHPVTCIL